LGKGFDAMAVGVRRLSDETLCGAGENRSARETADPAPPADVVLAAEESRDYIRAAIGGLTLKHKAVILGRHFDELTFEELGQELGISKGAAQRLHGRAVRCLKVSLELMGFDSQTFSFS
jgi:RNA polymerase sigma factor (sigma-70 family)